MANGQAGDWSNVLSNGFDYPTNQTTFYDVLRARGYHVMTTGKDDLVLLFNSLPSDFRRSSGVFLTFKC